MKQRLSTNTHHDHEDGSAPAGAIRRRPEASAWQVIDAEPIRSGLPTMIGEFDVTSSDASGLLPAQMSVGVRWDADTSGPRALMLAVLADAVRCIEQGRRRRGFRARRLAAEAEAWVRADRRDWPFSFLNVCEVLGFDPHALRTRLSAIRNDGSGGRRVCVRVPVRPSAMTFAPELRRVGTGGAQ